MLNQVKIENYRGFRSYRLTGTTTVNLLVGKNNSGKTALLEGIQLLASGGDPMVLINTARRRGEVVSSGREEPPFLDISHFFHGHDVQDGSYFSLAGNDALPAVTARIVPLDEVESQQKLFEDLGGGGPAFALRIEGGRSDPKGVHHLALSEEGGWLVDPRRPLHRYFRDQRREDSPIMFIEPDSVEPESLGVMWNQVLRDKQEGEVRKAMQILEPGLEDIVFQTGERVYRHYSGRSSVLVSLAGDRRRVPLGSMGDGMRRLLALSISLNHAKGGYLLIDEIDTGLHYSIMAKMWELVVRTAMDSNIQVFATTHSLDCFRGLAVLCKQSPEFQNEVSAHKIVRDLDQDVPFAGADLLDAVEQDIEIR